jgi:putative transposase
MSEKEYFMLVDKSGRLLHPNKRGAIDTDLAPILERIGAKPEAWSDTISCFEDKFRLAAGQLDNLRKFADQLGKRWFTGLSASRRVFVSSES